MKIEYFCCKCKVKYKEREVEHSAHTVSHGYCSPCYKKELDEYREAAKELMGGESIVTGKQIGRAHV